MNMRPNLRDCECCGNCKYSYFSQMENKFFCIKGFNSFKDASEANGAVTVKEIQTCDWYDWLY